MKFRLLLVGALALAGLSAMPARANTIILSLSGGTTTPGVPIGVTPTFVYTYNVLLTTNTSFVNNVQPSQFTLYDFGGYVSGTSSFSAAPALSGVGDNFVLVPGLLFDFTLTGPTYGANPAPGADSPLLANITYKLTGPGTVTNTGTDVLLGTLSLTSIKPLKTTFPLPVYVVDADSGTFNGPNFTQGPDQTAPGPDLVAPLPTSAVAGLGLFGLLGFGRRRKAL